MNMEKVFAGIIGVAMITTLILPKRNTVGVINAGGTAVGRILGTAMGTAKPV